MKKGLTEGDAVPVRESQDSSAWWYARPATPSSDRMKSILAACAKRYWSAMGTAAVSVMHRVETSAPSLFITEYQGSRYPFDDLPLPWMSREGSSDESCHVRNVPAALDLVARAASRGPQTNNTELQPFEGGAQTDLIYSDEEGRIVTLE